MKNKEIKNLAILLAKTNTEKEVVTVLKNAKFWFNEMKDKGWIKYEGERGCHSIKIIRKVDVEMMPRHPTAWLRNNNHA